MRNFIVVSCLAAFLFAGNVRASPEMDQLSFLTGCWQGQSSAGLVEEQYSSPFGESILGMSKVVVNGKTEQIEFIHIYRRGNDIILTPYIDGRERFSFALTGLSPEAAAFENPASSFPRKITYQRSPTGTLLILLEGTGAHGESLQVSYELQASACGR